MTLTGPELSATERFVEWRRVVEGVKNEHVSLGWSQYVFRIFREVFNASEELRQTGGFLMNAVARMYVSHALITFRRDLDKQNRTMNLRNLVLDMSKHANILTREHFLRPYADEGDEYLFLGNKQFERWSLVRDEGNPSADHLDPEAMRDELKAFECQVEKVRVYAERFIAHRTSMDDREVSLTFAEMHDAFALLRSLVNKYYALLTGGSVVDWTPTPQYNVLEPFQKPWLPYADDRLRAVQEAIDRDAGP